MSETFKVHGVVVHPRTRQPITGLRIEAWDKDFVCDDLVGSTLTDADGRFSFMFNPSYFQEGFLDQRPDLFFRVFKDDRLICDTRRSVIRNLAQTDLETVIEVDLPTTDVPPFPDGFDRDALLTLRGLATFAPGELREKAPDLEWRLREKALAEIRRLVGEAFAGGSEELRRHIAGVDLASLADGLISLRDLLRGSLDAETISEDLRIEGFTQIDTLEIPDAIDELVQPLSPVRDNPLFQSELDRGDAYRLAQHLQLDDATMTALDQRALHPGNIDHNRLAALVNEEILSEERARFLGLHANLYEWSRGHLGLIEAAKERVAVTSGRPMQGLRDLAGLGRADFARILESAQVELGRGETIESEADRIARGIEILFPREALEAQQRPVDVGELSEQIVKGELPDRLVNCYPGLRLDQVVKDATLTADGKAKEIARRVGLLSEVYRLNPRVDFHSIDTLAEADAIAFGSVGETDRSMVLEEVRTDQRLLRVTAGSAEQAYALKESGYHSALDVFRQPAEKTAESTGLPLLQVKEMRVRAEDLVISATAAGGTVIDRLYGGLSRISVDNDSPEIDQYLARLPDYAHYFGNQAYCQCRHCSSILSPAAYYVDLMEYVGDMILNRNFGSTRPTDHPLSLYNRRRDLWDAVPLTCEATDKLVPYLAIINEILENYIFSAEPGAPLPERTVIESVVYRQIYERDEDGAQRPDGFRQPFLLPLERLRIYLSHFSITHAQVAATVLDHTGDRTDAIPRARLGLSSREYALLATAHDDPAFLTALYLFDEKDADNRTVTVPPSGEITPFDAQRLLAPMGVTREELTALIRTRYVSGGASIRIQAERISAGSVQPDIERVYGLDRTSLDRLHRFVRLWRRLYWTLGELDLVLHQLGVAPTSAGLPLRDIAALGSLQERFRIGVEELCALAGRIPTTPAAEDAQPLFARLFDLPTFVRSDADRWVVRGNNGNFVHPAYRASDAPPDNTLARLLAGLRTDDGSLLVLLGPSAETGLPLTHDNLTRLYQHARLASLLKVSAAELLQLVSLSGGHPARRISSVAELEARLAFYDWWRTTRYTLDDLAFITRAAPVRDDSRYPTSATLLAELVHEVRERRLLTFADTVFGFFDGVTEAQSRAIVAENAGVFVHADLQLYRVSTAIDLETDHIAIPVSVPEAAALEIELRDRLRTHTLPGAPPFDDTVFAGVGGLSAEESRTIFAENSRLFEPVVDETLYRLAPGFDPAIPLVIPSGVPLAPEAAGDYIAQFHVGHVLRSRLSARLAISLERLDALIHLAGYDLAEPTMAAEITRLFHTQTPSSLVDDLVAALQRLAVLLRERVFTADAIRFVADHTDLFAAVDARAPTLPAVQALSRYRNLLAEDQPLKVLHAALSGYSPDATPPGFQEGALPLLAELLGSDRGLVASISRTVAFPGTGTSDPALQAVEKLRRCVELAQRLGVGGEILPLMAPTVATAQEFEEIDRAASALFAAIRTRFESEERWLETIEPLEDQIRQRQRDALSDFILRSLAPDQFHTTNDLYHWFLIDTQLEGCARTSKLVAGISSLQLYVQRVLLRLEQSEDGPLRVTMTDEAAAEWEWRKNYRLWEANRRVFLFPERYLLQELRDDKTELFQAEEADLLQKDLDEQAAEDAYRRYLDGFAEIAGLQVAGAYHDKDGGRDVVHLFGVSSSTPPTHFYRTIENLHLSELSADAPKPRWHPWRKVPLSIPVRDVSPAVMDGRLFIFWVEIATRAESPFDGYTHHRTVKFSMLRMDGAWTQPQQIALDGRGLVDDPIVDAREVSLFWSSVLRPRGVTRSKAEPIVAQITELAKRNPNVLSYSAYNIRFEGLWLKVPFTGEGVRKLFMPRFEVRWYGSKDAAHLEPKDAYTLSGSQWTRAYPSPQDGGINLSLWTAAPKWMTSRLDRYRLRLGPNLSRYSARVGNEFRLYPETRTARGIGVSDIGAGILRLVSKLRPYAEAIDVARSPRALRRHRILVFGAPLQTNVSIVNGSLSDGFMDANGDLFYLYRHPSPSQSNYIVTRLGTTLATEMARTVCESGVAALLDVRKQEGLREAELPFTLRADVVNDAGLVIDKGLPDFTGSLGVYFREMFLHLPWRIAEHLNSQQRFEAAQRWYQFIFDPTSNAVPDLTGVADEAERERRAKDRVWQFVEFRNRTLQTLRNQLRDREALAAYASDPFNPHAIARHRLDTYRRAVFMRYVENLIDWGDHLFAQDTTEAINEATMLYVMASDLLGPRPAELGDCSESSDDQPEAQTYDEIRARIDACPLPPVATFENLSMGSRHTRATGRATNKQDDLLALDPDKLGLDPRTGFVNRLKDLARVPLASFGSSFLRQVCVFCIPPNRGLHALWDRVEDRLFKIRNCINMAGVRRQLALFAPEIDPMLLVRAKAAGLSIQDVLDTTSGNLPPYRFSFLIVKAKEYAAALQSMGMGLLSALERRDAEELARLRLVHQKNIFMLTTQLRDQEIAAAEASLEALRQRRQTVTNRREYFQELIDKGWSTWEETQVALKVAGHGVKLAVPVLNALAGAFSMPPHAAGTSFSTPAKGLHDGFVDAANVVNAVADLSLISADLVATQAAFDRREEGWRHQVDMATDELAEIDKQILAQEIRVDLSRRTRDLHVHSQEQLEEIFDFYREKFPNLDVYSWLARTLQGLYREAYQSAYTMARLAERAYRFERRGDNTPLLRGSYWDASRGGLLAGDRLLADLRDLERRFMETHYRSMEVDQAFSLLQIDPSALISLKETGACEFRIPEVYFDLAYPGQYRRRIQSARLTIPCITGPYVNVGATLRLVESAIRNEPKTGSEYLVAVPPTRSVEIATSTAQNDAGVFRLDFRDERYMPFEGAGAVNSRWQLRLPNSFRPFDYSTVNDVILHVSYTAEYSRELTDTIESQSAEVEDSLQRYLEQASLSRALSLRQEFSNTFHRLLHVPAGDGDGAPLEISEKHFPLFLQGRALEIQSAFVILSYDEHAFLNEDETAPRAIRWPSLMFKRGDSSSPLRFSRSVRFGGLPAAEIILPSRDLDLRREPTTVYFAVEDAGDFSPREPRPSDSSPLDSTKLRDLVLYLEYTLATASPA